MKAELKDLTVIKVTVEDGTPKDGKTVQFVSLKVLDGDYSRTLWGFADSVQIPVKGDTINASVFISAKVSNGGKPYISCQVKSLDVVK
jgi:hypothetical protein